MIKLETQGEHTLESHVQDKVERLLTIQQTAAIEQAVAINPMANATNVRFVLPLKNQMYDNTTILDVDH